MAYTLFAIFVVIGYVAHWVTIIAGVIPLIVTGNAILSGVDLEFNLDWLDPYVGWSILICLGAAVVMVSSMQAQFQLKKKLT